MYKLVPLLTISAFLLTGCGGGGSAGGTSTTSSSSTSSSNSVSSTSTGYLIDSPVKGIKYKCGDIEDFTGDGGSFNYRNDCDVEFSVGNIKIGNMPKGMINTDNKVFPADLARVNRENTTDEKVKILARVLQTLDNDNNPDNGIEIVQTTHTTLESAEPIDLSSRTIIEEEVSRILADNSLILKDETEALNHYKSTLLKDLGISPNASAVPTASIYLNATISENALGGTFISKIPLEYFVSNPVSSISITGTGFELFDVDNSGNITLASSAVLDYEQTSKYDLTIVITDTSSNIVSASFKVAVTNENEIYPTLTSFTANLDENVPALTVVGKLQVTTNGSAIKTATLSGVGSSDFTIDLEGNIKVSNSANIDYESKGLYNLTASFENVNNNTSEVDVIININDLAENLVENPKTVAKLLISDSTSQVFAQNEEYIIISDSSDDEKIYDAGAIYIYKKNSNGSVKQIQKITASDFSFEDAFGFSLSIYNNYLIIGSRSGVYVFKNDGNNSFTEIQKLTASDGADNDWFGENISIFEDYIIIGAYGDDDNGSASGSAYIFKNDGNDNFTEIQKLTASDGASGDKFGKSVSMYNSYIIIGAQYDDDNGSDSGSVYVFKNDGNDNFTQIKKLTPNDGEANDYFGVSLSLDDNFIVIGSYGDDDYGSWSGSAYIFRNDGSDNFTQIKKINSTDADTYDAFGISVSISGEYIVIGADGENNDSGSAYIFKNDGSDNFIQIKKITELDTYDSGFFGRDVDIYSNLIIIGTSRTPNNPAYLYNIFAENKPYILNINTTPSIEENTTLVQNSYLTESSNVTYNIDGIDSSLLTIDSATGKLEFKVAPDFENPVDFNSDNIYELNVNVTDNDTQTSNNYAVSVTVKDNLTIETNNIDLASSNIFTNKGISKYNDYIVVGAPYYNSSTGLVYVLKKQPDGSIIKIQELTAYDGINGNYFGESVKVFGEYIIVGARGQVGGSVYVYKNDGNDNFILLQKLIPADNSSSDYFGFSLDMNDTYLIASSTGDDDNGSTSGSVYIFEKNVNGLFDEKTKLIPEDGQTGDYFGNYIIIENDYIIVSATSDDDNGLQSGSTYIFKNDGNGNFIQIQKLSGEADQEYFGSSISKYNNYLIIGAEGNSVAYNKTGLVYIFKNDGNDNFTKIQKLNAFDETEYNQFGNIVSIYNDFIAVGAFYDSVNCTKCGSVYLYKNNGNDNFIFKEKITRDTSLTYNYFGSSVFLDSTELYIGATDKLYEFKVDENDGN